MRIPTANIEEFQRLYKKRFGEEISSEEAQKQGLAVMRLVAITMEQNGWNLEDCLK